MELPQISIQPYKNKSNRIHINRAYTYIINPTVQINRTYTNINPTVQISNQPHTYKSNVGFRWAADSSGVSPMYIFIYLKTTRHASNKKVLSP